MMHKTVAGYLPLDWEGKLLKNVSNIVRGGSPRPAGSPLYFNGDYLPWTTVADITSNIEMYLTATKTMLTEEGSKRTRISEPGTLMLTNSGATLGVPKITKIRCGANDGIAMFLNLKGLAKEFAYYFLCSKTVYMREVIAPGVGQPNLNTELIGDIAIPLPPMLEQHKIAQTLSTWDKAISATERLIDNSKHQKKALMQQLLTGKKRLLDNSGKPFESEWKRVELGKLLDYKQPTPYLVKSTEYSNEYPTPVLTAGKTFILGYSNEDFGIFSEELPAIIFDDFTTASKFVDFPFKAKSSAMKILVAKDGVSIKYIYEAMQVLNYPVGGHQRHWISIFANLVIGLPSPEEQQKIATVLTNADKEVELLEQQLTDLMQEKKALMQQLLTGKRRVIV